VEGEEQGPAERSFPMQCSMEFEEGRGAGKDSKKKLRSPSRSRFLIVVFPWDEGQTPRRGLEVSLLFKEIP